MSEMVLFTMGRGWSPIGGIAVSMINNNITYYQTMIHRQPNLNIDDLPGPNGPPPYDGGYRRTRKRK